MSSFTQIIYDLRKEIEVIKKIQKIEDGEWSWSERLKAIDFLKAKLDQTLLCEKIANENKDVENDLLNSANLEIARVKQKHKDFVEKLKKEVNGYRGVWKRWSVIKSIDRLEAELESEVEK
jgi:hypothetical protein